MYAQHYYEYEPSISTNIMDRFRKMGWVPPSEDPKYLEKWKYYQECAWRKEAKMLSNTPKLYSHAELYQPAKPVQQKPVQAAPVNPCQKALYECGEALI